MVEVSIDAIVTATTFLVALVTMITFMRSEQKRSAEQFNSFKTEIMSLFHEFRSETLARFDQLEARMERLEARMDGLEVRVEGMDGNLRNVEIDISRVKGLLETHSRPGTRLITSREQHFSQ